MLMPQGHGGPGSGHVDRCPSPARAQPEQRPERAKEHTLEDLRALLAEADELPFTAPEIENIRQTVWLLDRISASCDVILQFVRAGRHISLDKCEAALSDNPSSRTRIPQLIELTKYVAQRKWIEKMDQRVANPIHYHEVQELLTECENTGLPEDRPDHRHFLDLQARLQWHRKAKSALSRAERTTLEDLATLVSTKDKMTVNREEYKFIERLHDKAKRWTEELEDVWNKVRTQRQTDANGETYGRAQSIVNNLAESHLILPRSAELKSSIESVRRFRRRLLDLFKDLSLESADAQNSDCLKSRERQMVDTFIDKLERCVSGKNRLPMSNRDADCFELMPRPALELSGRAPECRCSKCSTWYHKDCLLLAPDERMAPTREAWWECVLCDPSRLPDVLSNRKAVSLEDFCSLFDEWGSTLTDPPGMVNKDALFRPESAVFLHPYIEICSQDQDSIRDYIKDWLSKSSNPADPMTLEWMRHLLRRMMHSPVDYTINTGLDGVKKVVDVCAEALYQHHGIDTTGDGRFAVSVDRTSDVPDGSVNQDLLGQTDQNKGELSREGVLSTVVSLEAQVHL